METPAELLQETCKKEGLTWRALARQMGMSEPTNRRKMSGISPISEEEANAYAALLFKTRQEKEHFRRLCREDRDSRRKHGIRNQQKELREAKKILCARPGVSSGVQFTKETKKEFKRRQKQGDPDPLGDADFVSKGPTVWIEIRKKEGGKSELFACFYPDELILWDRQGKKTFLHHIDVNGCLKRSSEWGILPREQRSIRGIDTYLKFCRRNRIGFFVLLDMAYEKITESDLLDAHAYEIEGKIPIGKDRLKIMQEILQASIRWMEKGEGTKRKVLRDNKYLVAELDLFINSSKDIQKARESLKRALGQWRDMIPKSAPNF